MRSTARAWPSGRATSQPSRAPPKLIAIAPPPRSSIKVEPGPLFKLRTIRVVDALGVEFPEADLPQRIVGLKAGDPAAASEIRAAQTRIVDYFRKQGRPLAKIQSVAPIVDHAQDIMDVSISVAPGPIAPFGEATIKGPQTFDPAIVRSFLYIHPGDPYSPAAIADARNSIREIPAVGGVRITEGTTLDAYGRLPYQIDVEDRLPYAVGASLKYSTTNGPEGQVYWEDRNVFGGAERLRLQADIFYAPPWYISSQSLQHFSSNDIGGRVSASFLKPALGGTTNDLLIDALAEKMSTSGAGFVGYQAEDADVTASLRHRFNQNFWVQAGLEAQKGDATDALGTVNYTAGRRSCVRQFRHDRQQARSDARGARSTPPLWASATFLGSSLDLVQVKAGASAYYSIDADSRYVLAGRVAAGAMGGPQLDEIPANWRFYAGGGGSVRGYAYNELGPTVGGAPLSAGAACSTHRRNCASKSPTRSASSHFSTSETRSPRASRPSTSLCSRRRVSACAIIHPSAPFASTSLSPRAARRHRAGRGLCQHRAVLLMAQLFLRLKVLALIALLALCASAHAAEEDKGVLANLISRALSSPAMSVSIGAVDGVLSSDATISDIVLSDRQGPWLKVDKVRLVWNRLALFSRRLEVDQLTIGRMELLRRPLPSETPPPDTGAQQPILPELPVKVLIKQFGVQELSLGEPVVGVAARLNISGKATLGPPSEGLDLTLTAQRLDAPGDFKTLLDLHSRDRQADAHRKLRPSPLAVFLPISPISPACRRSSSPSMARAPWTISPRSSTSTQARTCGRTGR